MTKTIGEKIREARIAAGMTQKTLAGGEITRNMLCQIERGVALPSIATLRAIAARLEIPEGYFLSDLPTPLPYRKTVHMEECYRELAAGHHAEVLRLIGKYFDGEYDDEVAYVAAECHLALARRRFRDGSFKSALSSLAEAERCCACTRHDTGAIRAGITLLSAIATNVQSPRLEFDEERYQNYLKDTVDDEWYHYLIDDVNYTYRLPLLAEHLRGRTMAKEGRIADALEIFSALEEQKGDASVSAYFLFRLYSDIENAYREQKNYERAYLYSTKRLSLLSAFQS